MNETKAKPNEITADRGVKTGEEPHDENWYHIIIRLRKGEEDVVKYIRNLPISRHDWLVEHIRPEMEHDSDYLSASADADLQRSKELADRATDKKERSKRIAELKLQHMVKLTGEGLLREQGRVRAMVKQLKVTNNPAALQNTIEKARARGVFSEAELTELTGGA